MKADPDGDRPRQFVGECAVHLGKPPVNDLRCRERLTTGLTRAGARAKDRHHAVANELVRRPAGLGHGSRDSVKEMVEQEHHVVRQALFKQRGRSPDVDEHDRDETLDAAAFRAAPPRIVGGDVRRQQRQHPDVGARAELAREPHVRTCTQSRQRGPLGEAWRRQAFEAAQHADAAGGAAAPAAANRGVRNAGASACLEHGIADRHANHLAAGIGDGDRAAAALDEPARCPCREHAGEQDGVCPVELVLEFPDRHAHARVAQVAVAHHRLQKSRVSLLPCEHFAGALKDPEQRQHRQQHGNSEQRRGKAAVAGPLAEPEMNSQAAMRPRDEQHSHLPPAIERHEGKINRQHVVVAARHVECRVHVAPGRPVMQQQREDRKAEDEARQFTCPHAETAPRVERPQGEREMDRECAVERDRADRAVPNRIVDPRAPLHRVEGEVAQRMHGQMQREIGEHDQAGGEPETPIRHLVAQDGDCRVVCHERTYHPAAFPVCVSCLA